MHHLHEMTKNPALKFNYETQFNTPKAVSKSVPVDTQAKFDQLLATAREVHLIAADQFGRFLGDQFTAMNDAGTTTRTMLLASTNHAMTVALRIKQREGLAGRYLALARGHADAVTAWRGYSSRCLNKTGAHYWTQVTKMSFPWLSRR